MPQYKVIPVVPAGEGKPAVPARVEETADPADGSTIFANVDEANTAAAALTAAAGSGGRRRRRNRSSKKDKKAMMTAGRRRRSGKKGKGTKKGRR